MKDEIRIRLSLGLIAVAIVHAALLGLVFTALHRSPSSQNCDLEHCSADHHCPCNQPTRRPVGQIEKLPEPPRVNYEAQGEMKQQQIQCWPRRTIARPALQNGYNVTYTTVSNPRTVVSQVTTPSQPTLTAPAVVQPTVVKPTVVQPAVGKPSQTALSALECEQAESKTPIAAPASPPSKKSFQIALFLRNDGQSQRLQTWFDEHPMLQDLRESSEYQIYTAENAIYRTRYVNIVPVEQFPVVLFQDATGGHIHAAGRTMIPATPDELYSDLKQGYELYQQAKRAERTGAVKSEGYSWDDAISPTLYLAAEDCPDGYCPVTPNDTWRPVDRTRDGLFDRNSNRNSRSALFWMSSGEMATIALIGIAAILIVFIVFKRGIN